MPTLGCGCKICKAELGDYTNDLISNGLSPSDTLGLLQRKGVKTTEKLLRKHLSAFGIPYPETINTEVVSCEPVTVDLNKIDFSEYDFDPNNPDSVIGYLQKLNLKVYLNQVKLALKAQQDVIDGKFIDMPKEVMQNLAIAFQILDKSTAMSTHINQQEAIKIVERMGLSIINPYNLLKSSDVQNQTECDSN